MKASRLWLALCLCLLTNCTIGSTSKLPNTHNLPLYPGAQQVKLEQPAPDIRTTSFTTEDTSSVVLSWYKEALVSDGWILEKVHPDGLTVYLINGSDNRAYHLDVMLSANHGGMTKVELRLLTENPL